MPSQVMDLIHDRSVGLADYVLKALPTKGAILDERGPPNLRYIALFNGILVFPERPSTLVLSDSLRLGCCPTLELRRRRGAKRGGDQHAQHVGGRLE